MVSGRATGLAPSPGDGGRVFAGELPAGEIRVARGGVNTFMWRGGFAGEVRSDTRPINGKA